jgi:excisionase family DNA binding protein
LAVPKEAPERKLLRTWKEIAACLGVTVRSVERWEKQGGLPVYRQGSGRKARVYAYSDELLQWLERGVPALPDAGEAAPQVRRWTRPGIAAGGLTAAVVALIVCWQTGIWPARVPHIWRLTGGTLRIEDARHRLCWEKHLPPLDPHSETETSDKVLIADIDGDGHPEVVVNYAPADVAEMGGSVMCFTHRGSFRWQHRYGVSKTFGKRTFAPTYRGNLLRAVRVRGTPLLLTVANHFIWYPSQVALLDPRTGRVLEEYWHPGAIYECVLHDLDHDGQDEVLLGAINNPGEGLGHAALAVLKLPFSAAPRRIEAAGNPFPPATGGGELAYRLFPLPDTSRVAGQLPRIASFGVDPHNRILVETTAPDSSAIVYYLDFQLNVVEFRLSDNFAAVHERFYRQHLLDHPLTAAETTLLGKTAAFAAAPDGNSPDLPRLWRF